MLHMTAAILSCSAPAACLLPHFAVTCLWLFVVLWLFLHVLYACIMRSGSGLFPTGYTPTVGQSGSWFWEQTMLLIAASCITMCVLCAGVLPPGSVLADIYTVVDVLGAGSNAVTYRATVRDSRQQVRAKDPLLSTEKALDKCSWCTDARMHRFM